MVVGERIKQVDSFGGKGKLQAFGDGQGQSEDGSLSDGECRVFKLLDRGVPRFGGGRGQSEMRGSETRAAW
jgi:hypothetical protein